jgi:hypothetical protein
MIVEFSLNSTKRLISMATSFFLLTFTSSPPLNHFSPLRFLMPPRSSKNKSATEKGPNPPLTTSAGRQRTLTTKQQFLRKSRISTTLCLFLTNSSLEQEKENKIKAAEDKAYQDAVRAQQREEEFSGFRKNPAPGRARPQSEGKHFPFLMNFIDYEETDDYLDGPESEDNDNVDGVISNIIFIPLNNLIDL